jgi:hypothetical protein
MCLPQVIKSFQNYRGVSTTFYPTLVYNNYLVNKTNRCTEFQLYWYYYSTCFGQPFCPSSGTISRTSALVHFMQLWWALCYQEYEGTQFHPTLKVMDKMEERRKWKNSTTKKEGRTTEDWGTNWKVPQTRPRNNIWTAYGTRWWNVKENDDII